MFETENKFTKEYWEEEKKKGRNMNVPEIINVIGPTPEDRKVVKVFADGRVVIVKGGII